MYIDHLGLCSRLRFNIIREHPAEVGRSLRRWKKDTSSPLHIKKCSSNVYNCANNFLFFFVLLLILFYCRHIFFLTGILQKYISTWSLINQVILIEKYKSSLNRILKENYFFFNLFLQSSAESSWGFFLLSICGYRCMDTFGYSVAHFTVVGTNLISLFAWQRENLCVHSGRPSNIATYICIQNHMKTHIDPDTDKEFNLFFLSNFIYLFFNYF